MVKPFPSRKGWLVTVHQMHSKLQWPWGFHITEMNPGEHLLLQGEVQLHLSQRVIKIQTQFIDPHPIYNSIQYGPAWLR